MCCRYTRRRPDTHGGVLNVHTEGFLFFLSLCCSLSFFLSSSLLLSCLSSYMSLSLLLLLCFCFLLSLSLSSSLSAHTETRSDRQVTLPTKNRPCTRSTESSDQSVNLCYVTTWEVLTRVESMHHAPLLVVPIRPCLIFMFNVSSALPGFWTPPFSRDTVYRKINGRKLFGRVSNSTHAAFLWR